MLITFLDSKGIIHKEFVPTGRTVTGAYYLEVFKRLITRIRPTRPEYRDPDKWCLLHDNALSQNSIIVRQFLALNQVCVLNHPPYSPDLSSCDFSLFPKLKLKGCFFEDAKTIKTVSTEALEFGKLEISCFNCDLWDQSRNLMDALCRVFDSFKQSYVILQEQCG